LTAVTREFVLWVEQEESTLEPAKMLLVSLSAGFSEETTVAVLVTRFNLKSNDNDYFKSRMYFVILEVAMSSLCQSFQVLIFSGVYFLSIFRDKCVFVIKYMTINMYVNIATVQYLYVLGIRWSRN
jgi:hypothetical protein